MKPRIRKPDTRKRLSSAAVLFRVRRHCEQNQLLAIQRSKAPLGPVFTVSLRTGRVTHRNLASLGALAERLGLVKPWEVAS